MKIRIRAKLLLSALLFTVAAPAAFSYDDFIGNWLIEVVGSNEQWGFTHTENSTSIVIRGLSISQVMTINENDMTVVIPVLTVISDKFKYSVSADGSIDLVAYGKLNMDLKKLFLSSMDVQSAPNSVTTDAYFIIIEEMEKLFGKIALIRFKKIDKTASR